MDFADLDLMLLLFFFFPVRIQVGPSVNLPAGGGSVAAMESKGPWRDIERGSIWAYRHGTGLLLWDACSTSLGSWQWKGNSWFSQESWAPTISPESETFPGDVCWIELH